VIGRGLIAALAGAFAAGCGSSVPSNTSNTAPTLTPTPAGDAVVAWDAADVRVSDTATLFPGPVKYLYEPHLAIDPTDPDNVLVYAIDFSAQNVDPVLYSTSRLYRSTDGGATWIDRGPVVDGPETAVWNSGDPVILFTPAGIALYANLSKATPKEEVGGIYLHRSADGGETWDAPVLAANRVPVGAKCPRPDKQWIAHDRASGALHLVWTDFIFDCEEIVSDPLGVGGLLSYDSASIKLVTSMDEGRTWSAAELVHDGYANGAVPMVGPDGALHVATWGGTYLPNLASCPGVAASAAGVTFGDPRFFQSIFVATRRNGQWTEHEVPVCGNDASFLIKPGEFGFPNPTMAIDRHSGAIYVIYPQYFLPANRFGLMLFRSTDNGGHWSAPVEIPLVAGEDTYLPALHVADDGVLRVAYLITRAGDDSGDAGYTESHDGGATWSPRVLLSTQPMQLAGDPELGHYIGLDVVGDRIAAAWTDGRNADTEIWMRAGRLVSGPLTTSAPADFTRLAESIVGVGLRGGRTTLSLARPRQGEPEGWPAAGP
jgi:hypothetical protein